MKRKKLCDSEQQNLPLNWPSPPLREESEMKKRLGTGSTAETSGQGSTRGSRGNDTSPLKRPPDRACTAPRLSLILDPAADEAFEVELPRSRPPFRLRRRA